MKEELLSVIVPSYKQQDTILADLKKIYEVLQKIRYSAELICVVDGRVDHTFEKASQFAKSKHNVKVIGYQHNRGKGYAVRYGMANASGDIIAFIDGGMDIDPNGLSLILEHMQWYKADAIIGSKRHPASRLSYPWQRRVLSFGYQFLIRLLFGLKVKDTQVGLKIFRREVLDQVLPRLLVKRFAFDIEMLAVANYLGFKRIYEAPIQLKLDFGNGSSVTDKRFLKTIFLMMWDTLAVFYRLRFQRYYSDKNKRKWVYDPELNFRVNVG